MTPLIANTVISERTQDMASSHAVMNPPTAAGASAPHATRQRPPVQRVQPAHRAAHPDPRQGSANWRTPCKGRAGTPVARSATCSWVTHENEEARGRISPGPDAHQQRPSAGRGPGTRAAAGVTSRISRGSLLDLPPEAPGRQQRLDHQQRQARRRASPDTPRPDHSSGRPQNSAPPRISTSTGKHPAAAMPDRRSEWTPATAPGP
jgi:hypothetical protein